MCPDRASDAPGQGDRTDGDEAEGDNGQHETRWGRHEATDSDVIDLTDDRWGPGDGDDLGPAGRGEPIEQDQAERRSGRWGRRWRPRSRARQR